MVSRILLGATASLLLLAALPACGGSAPQPPGSTKVTMSDFKFEPKAVTVSGDKVVFFLVNTGSTGHDLVIEKDRVGTVVVSRSSIVPAGESATFTIDNLAPGSYFTRCDLPGHADSGMIGTLTVK